MSWRTPVQEAHIPDENDLRKAEQEAEAWRVRLDVSSVAATTVQAFFQWRKAPLHRLAYETAEARAKARADAVEAQEKRR